VLIADVAGYGRLSQIDEEGTRARFQTDLHDIFEPKIAAHHGRLVKTMGDGLLVEFHSVVDALRCAIDAQEEKAKRNAAAPTGQRFDFRIGVNLGDIIVEGDDIHGDGVNIANRVQALAEPGGVAISGTAYDQVKAKLPVGYASLGEQKVKSIAEPLRVYRVLMDSASAGKTVVVRRIPGWRRLAAAALVVVGLAAAAAWWRPWQETTRPSLVVLPFENLSDDKEQAYLADGITEDLTTDLARIPNLFVMSRNAAVAYKGKAAPPSTIAADLHVRYILEGSMRHAGGEVRINIQLIDGATGGQLWAERFDGASTDVLTLQEKVTRSVAAALELKLGLGQRAVEKPGSTNIPAAYDAYLQGLEYKHRDTPEDQANAAVLFRQAIDLDPNFGQAWAQLAWIYWRNYGIDAAEKALKTANFEMIPKARECLQEAAKHPSATYYSVLADLLLFGEGNSDDAITAAEHGVSLDRSDPASYEELSMALIFNGRASEAGASIDAAMRVDPNWTPDRHFIVALADFSRGKLADAVASLEKVDKPTASHLFLSIAAEGYQDHKTAATAHLKELGALPQEGSASGLEALMGFPFKRAADRDRLLDGLRKAGLPRAPVGYDWNAKERLSGEEIKSLIFGHQTLGILIETGDAYTRTTSADGAVNVTNGAWSDHGFSRIEGDAICSWVITRGRYCSTIFRNPSGSFQGKNEYVWVNPFNHFEFSIVK
jgi:TolB-like protein/class 3 adenylate cyclase/Flp pilus assembly protein TadD